MGKGRKPRPRRLKLLQGGKSKKRRRKKRAKRKTGIWAKAPDILPLKGAELWEQVGPELEKIQLLEPADIPAFLAMCMVYGQAFDAADAVEDDGQTTMGDKGTLKKHPQMTILNEMLQQFRQWCAEFGLTPAARERLEIPEIDEASELEKLLNA